MNQSKQVRLRPIEEGDLPALASWINDPDVVSFTGSYEPIPLAKQKKWYQALLEESNTFLFGIESASDSRLIGTCGLYNIHWRVRKGELRMRIGERDYWGKGLGTEATHLLVEFGFKDLNLHRIFLYVFANNERAIRVYEKCGFQREGILKDEAYVQGEYLDVVIMGAIH